MPKKREEDFIAEKNAKVYSFKQPKGIDLDAIAQKQGVRKATLIRNAVLEYLNKYRLTA